MNLDPVSLTGFRRELSGEEAFYKSPKYKERTQREMSRVNTYHVIVILAKIRRQVFI